MSTTHALNEVVAKRLQDVFTTPPAVIARAPGRVEVLGNHTDYNEGVVLSAAIDREVWVAAAKSPGHECMLTSTQFTDPVVVAELQPQQGANAWVNYPLGVYQVLKERGYPVSPFIMAIHSTVPLGAGVSSSAALEVGTALALGRLHNLTIDPTELAKICQKAENGFVGANCGLLDQFSSMFGKAGHLLFIDFRSLAHETIAMAGSDVTLAITLSGVTHALVAGEYNSRRHECSEAAAFFAARDPKVTMLRDVTMSQLLAAKTALGSRFYKRALHVVGEDERVFSGMELLKRGDVSGFGKLLYESHESSTHNFENSCPELDTLVGIAKSIDGVYGARLTGGGFGGAMLTFLKNDARQRFEETVTR
ncbi:MAG: galactokinase, partial [Chitinispirillaceae bacterium]|nr:galactokinase [Chitinispirillaceae bacterium]